MKIFISADIEGVCGIYTWDEANRSHPEYPQFQRQMQREVEAACQGALAAGATEVLVKDAHATGRNLEGWDLPRQVSLVRGWSGHPLCMVQELDESFDAVLLIGYHARAGSGGNPLAHTLSSRRIAKMRLNDRIASEFLLHTYAAELFEVPVVFVSGDEALCEEIGEVAPAIGTVATKRGVGPSVVSRHPKQVVDDIRAGVETALQGDLAACRLPKADSWRLELTYKQPFEAYGKGFYPGAEQTGEGTVVFSHTDYFEVLRALRFLV